MSDVLHYRPSDPLNWGIEAMDQMIGPDMFGRHLAIKSVEHDAITGISTAKLRAILPDEYRERILPLVEQQRERDRIRTLFNG